MKRLSETFVFIAAALAGMCRLAVAAEPVPVTLGTPTKVRIEVQACGPAASKERKVLEIEDPMQVKALASEFEALRTHSTGISAAKYSCSTDVTFLQGFRTITRIHVFPCSSMESAPVAGKRYFTYKNGFNRLPALAHIVGKPSREHECK